MKTTDQEGKPPLGEFERQVALVMEAIKREPSKEKQILAVYVLNLFSAVKETLKSQGDMTPFYIILANPVDIGVPPVTEEVVNRAKALNAAAVVSVEGFQSENDISDVIYHVSMSAPSLGVAGWVLKMKLSDGMVEFMREMPYFFNSRENVKTLGELISEMEEG
jgi:hypothetical protein